MSTHHVDFESESLIRKYKQDMLRPCDRMAVDKMAPVSVCLRGEKLIGFTMFDEGFFGDQFRVYFPESGQWVSVPKERLMELDGRELASLIEEKYRRA